MIPEKIYLQNLGGHWSYCIKEDSDMEYIRADIHLKAIDLMIIDRDAFHDRNVELEKKLESMKCCGNCDQENLEADCLMTAIDITQHNYICDNWKQKE